MEKLVHTDEEECTLTAVDAKRNKSSYPVFCHAEIQQGHQHDVVALHAATLQKTDLSCLSAQGAQTTWTENSRSKGHRNSAVTLQQPFQEIVACPAAAAAAEQARLQKLPP